MIDIGAIVGSGFRLMGRRPGAVLGWAAILFLGGLLTAFIQFYLFSNHLAFRTEMIRIGEGEQFPAFDLGSMATSIVMALFSLTISAVLSAAAIRAWLYPEDRGFASLRFGADELRMIGLTLLLYLLVVAAGLFCVLGLLFLVSATGFASGGSAVAAVLAVFLLGLLLLCAFVFVGVRLSLIFPLVLLRGRIGIDESWERTRGHFWPLLGAYILIVLITLAASLLVNLPLFAILAAVNANAPEAVESAAQAWVDGLARGDISVMTGWLAPIMVVSSLLNALMLTLWSAAVAEATLQLTGERGETEPETY